MKSSTVSRPTEAAALGAIRPRVIPPLDCLLWELSGAEVRQDREGAHLLGHLVVRATRLQGGEPQ